MDGLSRSLNPSSVPLGGNYQTVKSFIHNIMQYNRCILKSNFKVQRRRRSKPCFYVI